MLFYPVVLSTNPYTITEYIFASTLFTGKQILPLFSKRLVQHIRYNVIVVCLFHRSFHR